MKMIYIRTSYNTGLVLPMQCLPHIADMRIVNNDGYNEVTNLHSNKEYRLNATIIDSYEIDMKLREEENLEEAKKDLIRNQELVNKLEGR